MAAGADVIYQATFFDGTLARPRRLPVARRRPGAAVGLGPVPLRGRGHEARPPRQGERRPPDLLVHRPARRGSRASDRSGCTSRSAAAPGPWRSCASTTTWRTTGAPATDSSRRWRTRRRPTYPPAATYPEPVEHCDVCRWAAECVQRRRDDDHLSLVAGISGRQRQALTGRDVADARSPRRSAPADGPAARGRRRRGPRPRSRTGTDPAGGATQRRSSLRALRAGGRDSRSIRSAASRPFPNHRLATCSLTSKAIPMPSTTGSTTCSASWRPTAPSTPSGRRTTAASSARRRTARLRAGDRLHRGAPAGRSGPARLSLRRLRADRAQAARWAGTAPARRKSTTSFAAASSSTCSARFGSRCAPRSRATRSRRWRSSTDSRARSTCATPGRASSRSSSGWSSARASARPPTTSTRSRSYNRDDVVSTLRLRDWLEERRLELAELTGLPVPRPMARENPLPAELTEAQARTQALVERLADPAIAADRPSGPRSRGSRPLAARATARLASPRGQVDVVGVPPPHGSDSGAACRRGRAHRHARPGRADIGDQERQAGVAISLPRPGTGCRAPARSSRVASRRHRTPARSTGASAISSR